jgi:FkbM family methyltransferase
MARYHILLTAACVVLGVCVSLWAFGHPATLSVIQTISHIRFLPVLTRPSRSSRQLRSEFSFPAPLASLNCSKRSGDLQADEFIRRLNAHPLGSFGSACATEKWMVVLRDADFLEKSLHADDIVSRVMINIGANKGYLAAVFLGLWLPASLSSPRDVKAFLDNRSEVHPVHRCGVCHDCLIDLPPPPPISSAIFYVNATVFAIEPQPSNFKLLAAYAQIIAARGYVHAFQPFHIGISLQNGTGMFEERGAGEEGSSLGNANSREGVRVPVTVLDVDSFVSAHADPGLTRVIDILHIDTEGYDPAVLAGAASTLPFVRIVAFEYSELALWSETTLENTVNVLDATYGFDCYLQWEDAVVLLTSGCWRPSYETRKWSNVLCVNRRDTKWASAISLLAHMLPR